MEGLDSESYDRSYSDKELISRIGAYFKPFGGAMFLVAVTLALNSAAGSAGPIFISKALDLIFDQPTLPLMIGLSAVVVALGFLSWLFNYIRQRVTARVVGDVVLKVREDAYDRTIHHDLTFYDTHPSGKIVSRVSSDTQDFSQAVLLVTDLLSQVILVLILLVWLMRLNCKLTLLMMAMAPLAVLIALAFRKLARQVTRNSKRVRATINAQIQESISGIMVAKAFRQEKSLYTLFTTNNKQAYKVGIQQGVVLNLIFPVIATFSSLCTGLILYAAGGAVLNDGMSPGTWYLFMQAVGFFWWPMLNIASFWSQFQDGLSAAERVFALIDRERDVKQTADHSCPPLKGAIEFQNVSFAYNEKEQVLDNFSVQIRPGETIALVGHTCADKSSIARLITRFYEFQAGTILVDKMDIRSLNLQSYRHYLGLVPQDPYLFSGTVAANIRYGHPEATEQEVLYAATHVGKGEWLKDLSRGLETDVGQRGSSLSMGQRQLVALARVLLKNPAIFILDEATASVDPFTEVQIQDGLASVMQHRTALVIAHRLSTIKQADRILVIDEGKILEEGSHDSLLAAGGQYATLYNTYFRHQSLEYIEEKRP